MAARKTNPDRIEDLAGRLEQVEARLDDSGPRRGDATAGGRAASGYCSVPRVPERVFDADVSPERAGLIQVISKKWVNATVLHYYFFDSGPWAGGSAQEDVVRAGFAAWSEQDIGIEFKEVDSRDDAEIRIGFLRGDGAWSYVGRDCLLQGQNERTMNFGWDLTRAGEVDTAIHEIGHALGFPHEHQNPNAGIVWDEEAVYDALAGPPNFWSRDKTHWNIIRKIEPDSVEGSNWDADSIMHYPFGPGLIESPVEFRGGIDPAPGLSPKDIAQVRFFYPPQTSVRRELKLLESVPLSLSPGEQKDFSVLPAASRDYHIGTFGSSDTVIVLFEEVDGKFVYVDGDDDSGTSLNARLDVRLVKDRRYVLRVRLYYSFSGGDTAVMLW